MRLFAFIFAFLLLVSGMLHAQTTLELERCLQLAVDNNLQIKVSQNVLEISELTLVQKKFDFLPSVNMSLSANKSFGKSADIFTQAIAVSPWTSNPNLTASIVAFRGLAKWSELKNAEYTLAANQYSL